jgi:mycoredoxin
MGMDSEFPLPSGRGRRCATHSLAAGPDGQCALCRSESLPPPRQHSVRLLGGILVAILLVTAGALAHRGWQRAVAKPAKAVTIAAAEPVRVAPEPPLLEPPPTEQAAATSIPFEQPLPPPVVATLPAPVPPPAASIPTPARAAALPTRREPSEAELRAALNATPIVMYATTWCGVCRKARAFMAENGLRYQEIDADQAPGGWDKVQQLAGRKAVPVIVVDGDVSLGLSPERILSGVARSMERRLGITGVTFRPNRASER